jgi:hypothetical protein
LGIFGDIDLPASLHKLVSTEAFICLQFNPGRATTGNRLSW